MKVNLETERLVLRPFTMDDAQSMYDNWTSDSEVVKYVTWNVHENIETTRKILSMWIEQYEKPERINFAIVSKDTFELIGGIDVVGYLDGIPVIGYILSRKYWGNGFMTEACKKVIEFLFSLGYETIRIDALVNNVGSNKVIQKCGGVFIETYEDFFRMKNKTVKINKYYVNK